MFYFRLNKVRILSNGESDFLFFKKDLANVKLMSLVYFDDGMPELDAWLKENDIGNKNLLLNHVIQKIASTKVFTEVDNVRDDAVLTFGDTGYVLYQSKDIPDDFNWCLTVVDSCSGNIDYIGDKLIDIAGHPDFDGFASSLINLVVGAANPALVAGAAVTKFIMNVVGGILKDAGDKQLGILYMSLNKAEHYPHGERKRDDIPDLSGNIKVDYSIFAFD